METFEGILFFAMALTCFGVGYWRLTSPFDDLWQHHERALRARGLAPQRSEAWERSQRFLGVVWHKISDAGSQSVQQ